jgi:hypothetical protein
VYSIYRGQESRDIHFHGMALMHWVQISLYLLNHYTIATTLICSDKVS